MNIILNLPISNDVDPSEFIAHLYEQAVKNGFAANQQFAGTANERAAKMVAISKMVVAIGMGELDVKKAR